MNDQQIPLPLHGVWLPGKGWVRGADAKAFGDVNKAVAQELADRLGNGAKVYFIDPALVDLEQALLDAEGERIPLFKRIHRILKAG